MRFPTRLSLGLLATAFTAPLGSSAVAQQSAYTPSAPITLDHAAPSGYTAPAPGGAYAAATAAAAAAPKHNHKGLFGARHCTECQRARAKAESGVNVPPPPSYIPQGRIGDQGHSHVHADAPARVIGSTGCAACEADAAASGGVIVGPVTITETDALPPGHAVSTGVMTASNLPAGRATVGSDPAPVGISRASQGNFTPFNAMAAGGPRPALSDPSVTPTSMVPPAQTAIGGQESKHPRVISHLFGLPDLRRLRRQSSAYKSREGHASISYEENTGPVTELPASMVYGQSAR